MYVNSSIVIVNGRWNIHCNKDPLNGDFSEDREISRQSGRKISGENRNFRWDKLTGRTRVLTLLCIARSYNQHGAQQPCTKNPPNRKSASRPRLNSYQCTFYMRARYVSRKLIFQRWRSFREEDNLVLADADYALECCTRHVEGKKNWLNTDRSNVLLIIIQ